MQGDQYGPHGRWALLDHDLSTVIFHESGRRLIGLGEMQSNVDRWINRGYMPEKQRGWLVCGLRPGDGNWYRQYAVAEYLAGYAGRRQWCISAVATACDAISSKPVTLSNCQ